MAHNQKVTGSIHALWALNVNVVNTHSLYISVQFATSKMLLANLVQASVHTWEPEEPVRISGQMIDSSLWNSAQHWLRPVVLNLFFHRGRSMVQVQVSRPARMSFTYYVINTNQPDL